MALRHSKLPPFDAVGAPIDSKGVMPGPLADAVEAGQ